MLGENFDRFLNEIDYACVSFNYNDMGCIYVLYV